MLSSRLQENGFRVVRYSPQQINTGATAQVAKDLKHAIYHAIWIDLPLAGRHVPKDRMHSALTQVCRWLQLASESEAFASVFGAFGHAWNHEGFQALMREHGFKKSFHRACHFGFKLDIEQPMPSKICFVCLSCPKLPSHPCRCNVSQNEHKLDWSTSQSSVARRPRQKLQQDIALAVVQTMIHTISNMPPKDKQGPQNKTHVSSTETEQGQEHGAAASRHEGGLQQSEKQVFSHDSIRKVHDDTPDCLVSSTSVLHEKCQSCHMLMPSSETWCRVCEEPIRHTAMNSQDSQTALADSPNLYFPTEEKIRQKDRLKKMKAAGEQPKTRKVHIESHFDDCGTDFGSLAPFMTCEDNEVVADSEPLSVHHAIECVHGFDLIQCCEHTFRAETLEVALHVLSSVSSNLDFVEICGGVCRTSAICIRKHLPAGENFDLITHCNLSDPRQQELVLQYFEKHRPLVAIMSPRSIPSELSMHHESPPHSRFCAELALFQHQNQRFSFWTNPARKFVFCKNILGMCFILFRP